jgi:hypothetical protein
MPLSDITIRNAKPKEKQYKLSDAGGLYLLVKPNGEKYWRLKYRVVGKEKLLSIGTYPLVSLAEAREKAIQAKKQLQESVDPSYHKQETKRLQKLNTANSLDLLRKRFNINFHIGGCSISYT